VLDMDAEAVDESLPARRVEAGIRLRHHEGTLETKARAVRSSKAECDFSRNAGTTSPVRHKQTEIGRCLR
jgi:hypothetical protein